MSSQMNHELTTEPWAHNWSYTVRNWGVAVRNWGVAVRNWGVARRKQQKLLRK